MLQIMKRFVVPAWISGTQMPGMACKHYIHGVWIPAQICLEQICINPMGIRQDSLM